MARQSEALRDADQAVPVLLTRPQAQAEAFARQLTQRLGPRVRPVIAPLMAPEYLSPPLPEGPFAAAIFTSAHGVEGAIRLGIKLPPLAYCVGRSTAAAARAAGLDARSADGNAEDLATAILNDAPNGRLVYIRGVDTSGDIANELISNSIPTLSLQVYLQKTVPFERESLDLLRQITRIILPLFSPRSARIFREAMPPDARAGLHIVAMSDAVAQAADRIPHGSLVIAARPDSAAVLDSVESLLATRPLP
ncbi:MAG: uroporphyrinogen-III synthase [Tabrizicola sp.]